MGGVWCAVVCVNAVTRFPMIPRGGFCLLGFILYWFMHLNPHILVFSLWSLILGFLFRWSSFELVIYDLFTIVQKNFNHRYRTLNISIIAGNYVNAYSDSGGNIAFYEPGVEGDTFFSVFSDGYVLNPDQENVEVYDAPYDSGIHLNVSSGGSAVIFMDSTQLAQRLFRLTGSSLYADSMLNHEIDTIPRSILMSNRAIMDDVKVLGQDTVMTVTYHNEVLWFFGDTTCLCSARQNNCEEYGMYTVGASSCVPANKLEADSLICSPSEPPPLKYFSNDDGGFLHVAPMATLPPLDQNTWIAAVFTLVDEYGEQHLYANYMKNPGDGENAGATATGMVKWNDDLKLFDFLTDWPDNHTFLNGAHTVQRLGQQEIDSNYIYFNSQIRVYANEVSISNHSLYQYFNHDTQEWLYLDQTSSSSKSRERRIKVGKLKSNPSTSYLGVSSIEWNSYVAQYVYLLDAGSDGMYIGFSANITSQFDTSTAIKVADHQTSGSSCYNQLLIPQLFEQQDRIVKFACTFTAMWSETPDSNESATWSACLFGMQQADGCSTVVSRYEYNNLIYSVDLIEI